MKYLTLLEKLKILLDVLLSHKLVLYLIIIILLFTILYICKKINNKKYTIFTSISLLITLILCIIKNYKILSNTFDNFMTIFISGIYFPSIYIYISVFIIILLAFIISIISNKKKIYKIINSITLIINIIFLIIILSIISENNINVFQISSLYTNNTLVVILELNMLLFILWISSLVVAYITNVICDKITIKKNVKNELVVKEEVLINEVDKEALINEVDKEVITNIVENINEEALTNIENISEEVIINEIEEAKENNTILANITEVPKEDKVTFNDILNGLLPVTYYEKEGIDNINYNISNPQEIYENNYNNLKKQLKEDTIVPEVIITKPEVNIIKEDKVTKPEVNIIKEVKVSEDNIIDKTNKIKEENMKKNLVSNTISLNDLIKDDKEIDTITQVVTTMDNTSYTLEDYKKIITMLKEIKNSYNKNNITIDDAVTMSLISNYSIDDCVKFKEILESNLN